MLTLKLVGERAADRISIRVADEFWNVTVPPVAITVARGVNSPLLDESVIGIFVGSVADETEGIPRT
jgi:hypothetical protein